MLTTAPRAYGVADPAEVRQMSGREFLQAMMDGRLPAPPIMKTLSFWLAEIGDGFAAFEGDAGPHLLNPLGIVHGGWALTLIDSAAGCAAHTLMPAGGSYATIETKANFSRPIAEDTGRVRAEGRAVGRGRRIISCEARVVDAKGRLLAHGTSTLMVLPGGDERLRSLRRRRLSGRGARPQGRAIFVTRGRHPKRQADASWLAGLAVADPPSRARGGRFRVAEK